MTFAVWVPALRRARNGWLDRADELHRAARDLEVTEWSLLGPRVAAAAEPFGATWSGELRSLRDAAEASADGIGSLLDDAVATDLDVEQGLRRLSPPDLA